MRGSSRNVGIADVLFRIILYFAENAATYFLPFISNFTILYHGFMAQSNIRKNGRVRSINKSLMHVFRNSPQIAYLPPFFSLPVSQFSWRHDQKQQWIVKANIHIFQQKFVGCFCGFLDKRLEFRYGFLASFLTFPPLKCYSDSPFIFQEKRR